MIPAHVMIYGLTLGAISCALLFVVFFQYRIIEDLRASDRVSDDVIESLRRQRDDALRRMHDIAGSAMRGSPAVKWTLPQPVPPGAEPFRWRVMIAGEAHLFPDAAVREARRSASFLLPPVRVVQTNSNEVDRCESPRAGEPLPNAPHHE
jgi:hypothetical protein